METEDLIEIFNLLVPGFVAAWIFYGLTAHPKPAPFERVVQALVFNIIIQPIAFLIGLPLQAIGKYVVSICDWTVHSETATSVLVAGAIGMLFAGLTNSDVLHDWLRHRDWRFRKADDRVQRVWKWTMNNPFPSEWYSAFSRRSQYVILHLAGGRRLYGWPDEFPDESANGHFVISEPEWLEEDGQRDPLPFVEAIVIPSSDVRMVEFMQPLTADELATIEHGSKENTNGDGTETPTERA